MNKLLIISGPSGGGKGTIVKYLEELYQPHATKGAVKKGENPGPGPKIKSLFYYS